MAGQKKPQLDSLNDELLVAEAGKKSTNCTPRAI